MDFGTIFGLIFLIICVLAVVLISSNTKRKEKQFVQMLFDMAIKSNCKISEHDHWNNILIGIDKSAHKLFFIRKTADSVIDNEINLVEIQKCRINNQSRVVGLKGSTQNVVDKLELAFTYRDSKKPDTTLEFYNAERDNLTAYKELSLIEKWLGIANKDITDSSQK